MVSSESTLPRQATRLSQVTRPVGAGLDLLDRHLGLIFILPGLACLLAVIAYPIVFNLTFSLTDKDLVFPQVDFVGTRNYLRVLGDAAFWHALQTSLIWTFTSVAGQLLLGMVAALALDRVGRGGTAFRMLLIIPWTYPSIVLAFSWRWMLDGLYGVVNYLLLVAHLIAEPVAWLGKPETALATIILVNIWFGFPFMMLAILSGLQTIPPEHYELARIEGASFLQELRYLILPSIRGVVGILVVLRTIWVFNNFDFIYLTTGGGPVNLTETLPIYAFRIGWLEQQVGRMAAVAVLMIVVLSIITTIYFRLLQIGREEA